MLLLLPRRSVLTPPPTRFLLLPGVPFTPPAAEAAGAALGLAPPNVSADAAPPAQWLRQLAAKPESPGDALPLLDAAPR